jgi:hypothetical protein
VATKTGGEEVNADRTSKGMFFQRGENELVKTHRGAHRPAGELAAENGEGLQVLQYVPGTEYKPHYDYFDPNEPGTPTILKRGGQRVGTLVMYLGEPEKGRRHHLSRRAPGSRAQARQRGVLQLRAAAPQHQDAARRRAGDRGREMDRHQVAARTSFVELE